MTAVPKAGEIVIVDFPGVQGVKRRPAIIISSDLYHQSRPDVIVALITSQLSAANKPTDHILQDWQAAGLRAPSAFRAFLNTLPRTAVTAVVGRASDNDWQQIVSKVLAALASS